MLLPIPLFASNAPFESRKHRRRLERRRRSSFPTRYVCFYCLCFCRFYSLLFSAISAPRKTLLVFVPLVAQIWFARPILTIRRNVRFLRSALRLKPGNRLSSRKRSLLVPLLPRPFWEVNVRQRRLLLSLSSLFLPPFHFPLILGLSRRLPLLSSNSLPTAPLVPRLFPVLFPVLPRHQQAPSSKQPFTLYNAHLSLHYISTLSHHAGTLQDLATHSKPPLHTVFCVAFLVLIPRSCFI